MREGSLYFYININADGKGHVERKRLIINKRKSIQKLCELPVKAGGNGIQNTIDFCG